MTSLDENFCAIFLVWFCISNQIEIPLYVLYLFECIPITQTAVLYNLKMIVRTYLLSGRALGEIPGGYKAGLACGCLQGLPTSIKKHIPGIQGMPACKIQ